MLYLAARLWLPGLSVEVLPEGERKIRPRQAGYEDSESGWRWLYRRT
jgi:hypothetical protein